MSSHQMWGACVGTVTTLVEAVQAGDPDAFATLVRRFQDMAYGYRGRAYQILGAQEQAIADYHKALTLLENAGQRRWVQEKLATLQATA